MDTTSQNKEQLRNSEGHRPGLRSEEEQAAGKPMADSPATAGVGNRDEDAADPEFAASGTSKGFDRDQQELDLGFEDGDLDTDEKLED